MESTDNNFDFSELGAMHKKKTLFEEQKRTLDLFLERHAITKEQYDTGLNALKEQLK